jgi:hypothetical protein
LWLVILLVAYIVADLNSWSAHPFYRRRLASAYCLKRLSPTECVEVPYETVTSLSAAQPQSWRTSAGPDASARPELVVCAAANLSDRGLVPPGRLGASFVFTPSVIGALFGEAESEELENDLGPVWQKDITLMASVATSGAAFSPAMGKMTKAQYRFLMALFNLRLGLWLPNPKYREHWAKWQYRPGWMRAVALRPRPHYLIKEMLGLNSAFDKYLYVTDGGHYDNLGLVELFRRGCTEIYCFDATGGGADDFSTLREAVRIARVDIGVEVNISMDDLKPQDGLDGRSPTDHVVGNFEYSDGRQGVLYFARAALTPDLPLDIETYARKNRQFPHDPTFDQFFDEAQFEAYRQLGRRAAHNVLESASTI